MLITQKGILQEELRPERLCSAETTCFFSNRSCPYEASERLDYIFVDIYNVSTYRCM